MRTKVTLMSALVAACLMTAVRPAAAQHRGDGHTHAAVVVGGAAWGPWGPWGGPFWPPYYPPYYPPYPPYPYYVSYDNSAHLKTEVKPKQAQIYVDGYYAGIADDFDGIFQSLRVAPGAHVVTVFLEGYRTVTRRLYLGPDQTTKMHLAMEPLRPGEVSERPTPPARATPAPATPGAPGTPAAPAPPATAPPPPGPPPAPSPEAPPAPEAPGAPAAPEGAAAQAAGFGAVSIRVQPADASVSIDGQPWTGPAGAQPLVVQLAEGAHTIEIRKDGYRPFSIHIEVRSGETTPVNVRLPPAQ